MKIHVIYPSLPLDACGQLIDPDHPDRSTMLLILYREKEAWNGRDKLNQIPCLLEILH